VLFIDEEIPYPINTGKRARTFNLLTRLSKKNDITYLSYVDKAGLKSGDSIMREHAINFIPVKRTAISKDSPFFYFRLLYNLFSKYPYIVAGHYSSRMQRQLNELLVKNKYDLLHCEISPYGIFMQNQAEIPKVIVAHNVESEIWQRYYDEENNFIKKRYIGLQLKRLIDYESEVLKKFDVCISVSNRDAKYLNRHWQIPEPAVVDNGVDTEYFRPVREPYTRHNLVFTGSMDWRPNQHAVLYFVKDILPKIRAEVPDATFTIVGRKPPTHIRDLEKAYVGIKVTGTVNDVRPFIAEGQVFVVPLKALYC
jgi:glycosyltransferase involved in cell wall biosynthesis